MNLFSNLLQPLNLFGNSSGGSSGISLFGNSGGSSGNIFDNLNGFGNTSSIFGGLDLNSLILPPNVLGNAGISNSNSSQDLLQNILLMAALQQTNGGSSDSSGGISSLLNLGNSGSSGSTSALSALIGGTSAFGLGGGGSSELIKLIVVIKILELVKEKMKEQNEPPASPPTSPPDTPPASPPTSPPDTPPASPPTSPPDTPPASPPTSPPNTPPTSPPTSPPDTPQEFESQNGTFFYQTDDVIQLISENGGDLTTSELNQLRNSSTTGSFTNSLARDLLNHFQSIAQSTDQANRKVIKANDIVRIARIDGNLSGFKSTEVLSDEIAQEPPTSPPTSPPNTPPTSPPTSPPNTPPTSPPTSPPNTPPTSPPTTPPVSPPVNPPVTPPVSPPNSANLNQQIAQSRNLVNQSPFSIQQLDGIRSATRQVLGQWTINTFFNNGQGANDYKITQGQFAGQFGYNITTQAAINAGYIKPFDAADLEREFSRTYGSLGARVQVFANQNVAAANEDSTLVPGPLLLGQSQEYLNQARSLLAAMEANGRSLGDPSVASSEDGQLYFDLIERAGKLFSLAGSVQSPIIFDMDGNGSVDLTSVEDGVLFDIDGDGTKEKVAWTQAKGKDTDGWLALDINKNGLIDSGKELFGNQHGMANGFKELAKYDDNKDGIIDSKDKVYKDLVTWQDLNHDGISQSNEKLSLQEAGVKSINLGYLESDEIDEHGNELRQQSLFTRTTKKAFEISEKQGISFLEALKGKVIDAWLQNRQQ